MMCHVKKEYSIKTIQRNTIALTIVEVPCLSGAPWESELMTGLAGYRQQSIRLAENLDTIEQYADQLSKQVDKLESYVLVGDSFGAVISLALAVRRPRGLKALVMSGGFAADPVDDFITRLKTTTARILPKALYKPVTLHLHAQALASPHDGSGNCPWTTTDSYQLFANNTPHESYVARSKASFNAHYVEKLDRVNVPTLIITPSHDTLIGPHASEIMKNGIADAEEIILPNTGHMLRFSHPALYSATIADFLAKHKV